MSFDYNKAPRIFKRAFYSGLGRTGARWAVVFLILSLSGSLPGLFAKSRPKALPLSVSIREVVENEDRYDGRRIVVSGRIQSIFLKRGRLGMPYLEIHLIEDGAGTISDKPSLEVISLQVQKIRPGDKVIVQGSYRVSGKKAGHFLEHFLDAEIVLIDLS